MTINQHFKIDQIDPPGLAVFMRRLKQIYASMDDAYNRAAKAYGFTCDGCQDNCCRTRFHHHTIIESAYLKAGLMTLKAEAQDKIKSRAMIVIDATDKADHNREAVRLMCPLNFDTRCILYLHRPMICRLHGIPHELQKPRQQTIRGPGCETFNRRCGSKRYFQFDRTPFYHDMAKLEHDVKRSMDLTGKIRMTVSEMILS